MKTAEELLATTIPSAKQVQCPDCGNIYSVEELKALINLNVIVCKCNPYTRGIEINPDDIQSRLKAGAKIVFESSFEVEEYYAECKTLLTDVFEQNVKECFISDKSTLLDFEGCGDYKASEKWDDWAANKIWLRFGVRVEVTDTIVTVCKLIRNYGCKQRGLH